jgi:hypothetical protein
MAAIATPGIDWTSSPAQEPRGPVRLEPLYGVALPREIPVRIGAVGIPTPPAADSGGGGSGGPVGYAG